MAKQTKKRNGTAEAIQQATPRTWVFSLVWATVIVGVSIIASATINPLFGRYVHWDWMAAVAPVSFILLTLAKHTRIWFAVAMQNVFWLWGHRAEIAKLAGPECLGMPGAIGLFLLLGILGDVIALRTRNVLGLAIGHILLNLAMILYIRGL